VPNVAARPNGTFLLNAYLLGNMEGFAVSSQTGLQRTAYAIAWQEFTNSEGLTPDERMSGPNKLRWYVQVLTEAGERDPEKMAKLALGMMRAYQQIVRSKARVEYTFYAPPEPMPDS
jgi:hypothetical protein